MKEEDGAKNSLDHRGPVVLAKEVGALVIDHRKPFVKRAPIRDILWQENHRLPHPVQHRARDFIRQPDWKRGMLRLGDLGSLDDSLKSKVLRQLPSGGNAYSCAPDKPENSKE